MRTVFQKNRLYHPEENAISTSPLAATTACVRSAMANLLHQRARRNCAIGSFLVTASSRLTSDPLVVSLRQHNSAYLEAFPLITAGRHSSRNRLASYTEITAGDAYQIYDSRTHIFLPEKWIRPWHR